MPVNDEDRDQDRDRLDAAGSGAGAAETAWDAPGVTVTDLPGGVPGWFARPQAPGPVPAVVLVHPAGAWDRRGWISAQDSGAERDVFLFDGLAGALLRAGVAVVGFDARFVTARRGDGWEPDRVTFPGLVQDVVSLVGFLRAHPAVDAQRISLLGISLGTHIAAGAAARDGAGFPCRLILGAPGALSLDRHLSWTLVGRRLEWLLAAGVVGPDGGVDLGRVARLGAQRAGWWDDFDAAHFDAAGSGHASYEQVAGVLMYRHDEYARRLFSVGDAHGPVEYWRSWRAWPVLGEVLAGLRGRVWLHVGDEDWTSAPRQSWLLAHSAPPGLAVQVTVHPDLGHLFSPRDAHGRLTYGPIHPSVLAAMTACAVEP